MLLCQAKKVLHRNEFRVDARALRVREKEMRKEKRLFSSPCVYQQQKNDRFCFCFGFGFGVIMCVHVANIVVVATNEVVGTNLECAAQYIHELWCEQNRLSVCVCV